MNWDIHLNLPSKKFLPHLRKDDPNQRIITTIMEENNKKTKTNNQTLTNWNTKKATGPIYWTYRTSGSGRYMHQIHQESWWHDRNQEGRIGKEKGRSGNVPAAGGDGRRRPLNSRVSEEQQQNKKTAKYETERNKKWRRLLTTNGRN